MWSGRLLNRFYVETSHMTVELDVSIIGDYWVILSYKRYAFIKLNIHYGRPFLYLLVYLMLQVHPVLPNQKQ